jgi:hypothetical protein
MTNNEKKQNIPEKDIEAPSGNNIHTTRRKIEDILLQREQEKLFEL